MLDQEHNDEIWAESDEEHRDYEKNLAEKEWDRLQDDHGNSGYKEGIIEGKEVNMQRGFDEGYKEGLAIGKAVGKLRGLVSTRLVFYKHILKNEKAAKELESLFDEIDSIEVNHIFSTDYFRKGGPKDKTSYVAPEDFVRDLKEKVNAQLEATSKRYSKQY
ncbi:hypothetical protein G6F37_012168 [Rhizopus arrhizus]|nr:hypothetical protein G6F38_006646 [Rhizopus arrhizus]KAG1145303.1 hypothetical protein G6F37_012168 [Rhizopus arrhizus]